MKRVHQFFSFFYFCLEKPSADAEAEHASDKHERGAKERRLTMKQGERRYLFRWFWSRPGAWAGSGMD